MNNLTKSAKQGFAKGLTATFAGKSDFQKITRGAFQMASSSVAGEYVDQWIIGRTTGGQEILDINGNQYTRVYAGGVISEAEILALGITHKQVLDYLASVLVSASDKTRFDEAYTQKNGDWEYEYSPDHEDVVLELMTGNETISYRHTVVFIHRFIVSPIYP